MALCRSSDTTSLVLCASIRKDWFLPPFFLRHLYALVAVVRDDVSVDEIKSRVSTHSKTQCQYDSRPTFSAPDRLALFLTQLHLLISKSLAHKTMV